VGDTGAQVVNKNHGDTFPRENTRWEEEEIVLSVQALLSRHSDLLISMSLRMQETLYFWDLIHKARVNYCSEQ
jgi:hypothetical protein